MVFIILPAFNEEKAIGTLCKSITQIFIKNRVFVKNRINYQIIVVNDGSTDQTQQIVEAFTKRLKVKLVNHPKNKGLGEAIKTGFNTSLTKAKPNDLIVTMDADNTHPPSLIPQMVKKINQGNDLIIASRFIQGSKVKGVPFYRQILSNLSSSLFRIIFPIKGVTDYTSGFRVYRADILKKAKSFYGNTFINQKGFSCMADILLKLARFNITEAEVPLTLRYDLKQGRSKMKVGATILETLLLIIRRRLGDYS